MYIPCQEGLNKANALGEFNLWFYTYFFFHGSAFLYPYNYWLQPREFSNKTVLGYISILILCDPESPGSPHLRNKDSSVQLTGLWKGVSLTFNSTQHGSDSELKPNK